MIITNVLFVHNLQASQMIDSGLMGGTTTEPIRRGDHRVNNNNIV